MTHPLSALLRSVQHAGIDIDAETVLDSIWLALRMRQKAPRDGTAREGATAEPDETGARTESEGTSTTGATDSSAAAQILATITGEFARPIGGASPAVAARSITLSRAAALPESRELVKALRPLRRRVVSPGSGVIDIETTVRSAAEEDLWIPSFEPARERWLDVLLVADHGLSMIVWRETIDEFERVLRTSGAFRSVRSWWMESDTPTIAVFSRGRGQSPASAEKLTRLVQSPARSVILVISDCTGARWHDGEIPRLMAHWSRLVPLALMQVTPEWFWARTALGDTVGSRFRSPLPVAVNRQLGWDPSALGTAGVSRETEEELLRVPAATLTSNAVARVANLIAGVGREWAPGVVFDLTWEGDGDGPALTAADAEERVARFLALASKDARRLAAAYAASPVRTLGVLRLLRRDLLPEASPFAEAEVLLGGIVRVRRENASWDRGASLPLEFFPGVQSLLLDGALAADVLRVLEHAAAVAATGVGATFKALLDDPSSATGQLDPRENAFAAAAAEALERLGGAYARTISPVTRREREDAAAAASPDPIEGEDGPVAPAEPAETPGRKASHTIEPDEVQEEGAAQPEGDEPMLTMEFLISGRVAGVGFRYFTQQVARELGLEGTAENLPDGRVRVRAIGGRSALARLEERLRRGPAGAAVTEVESRVVETRQAAAASTAPKPSIPPDPTPTPSASRPSTQQRVRPSAEDGWPFLELALDERGRAERSASGAIASAISASGISDLFVLVHGWNVDRTAARDTYRRLLEGMRRTTNTVELPLPRIGALGVLWPSARWGDDDDAEGAGERESVSQGIDPESERRIEDATSTVSRNPDDPEALERLESLVRGRSFIGSLWDGARNVARMTTYYQMKKRAGVVGREGLGPFLGQLAARLPELRVHLIGHSVGARLAAHALTALPRHHRGAGSSVKSVVLLQGFISHHAFAPRRSPGTSAPGALADVVERVDGPLVITYSRSDRAAGTVFELAARVAGRDDDAPGEDPSARGAIGFDGAQGVDASEARLGPVGTRYPFDRGRICNIDASALVSSHGDILDLETAWLLVAAARFGELRPGTIAFP